MMPGKAEEIILIALKDIIRWVLSIILWSFILYINLYIIGDFNISWRNIFGLALIITTFEQQKIIWDAFDKAPPPKDR